MAKVGKFCLAKRVKVEWLFQECFWTYIIEITYYSGEKKRQFKVNIDNGKITHL